MEVKFAKLSNSQIAHIIGMSIGTFTITDEQVKEVEEILKLEGKDWDELQAIRNTICCTISDLKKSAREMGNWELFDQLQANMSGSTTVIDIRMNQIM